MGSTPPVGTRPCEVRIPNTPHSAAGFRTEPPVSDERARFRSDGGEVCGGWVGAQRHPQAFRS
jgi:hypothetical protein